MLVLFRLMTPAPALNVAAPAEAAWASAPVCEMPRPVSVNVPEPTLEAARLKAMLSVRATLLLPLFDSVTAPVNELLLPLVARSMAFAPAVKLEAPATVNAPVCVIPPKAPFAVAVRLPPMLLVPKTRGILLTMLTA